jgi:hypothetical protein
MRSVFSPSNLILRRLRQRIFETALVLAPLAFLLRLRKRARSYHPELHYMRGPGPKWHEKHAHAASVLSVPRYR